MSAQGVAAGTSTPTPASTSTPASIATPAPKPPHLTWRQVIKQAKRDIYDKEVQSAATYSYLWLADQMGHVGLGLLFTIVLGFVFQFFRFSDDGLRIWLPLVIAIAVAMIWEYAAYSKYAALATPRFRPDTKMLAYNAVTATIYMVLGIILGMAWQCALLFRDKFFLIPGRYWPLVGVGATIFCVVAAVAIGVPWVRQKMIWQKAGMPYLFRLANAPLSISPKDAGNLQHHMDQYVATSAGVKPPIILYGKLQSGKTSIACGIGTEAAFQNRKVRYVTFDKLGQMVDAGQDYLGPNNIGYWRWTESEILIIDDVDSGSEDLASKDAALSHFNSKVADPRLSPDRFAGRLTVWVLGPREAGELSLWERAIAQISGVASSGPDSQPLTIRLDWANAPKKAGAPTIFSRAVKGIQHLLGMN